MWARVCTGSIISGKAAGSHNEAPPEVLFSVWRKASCFGKSPPHRRPLWLVSSAFFRGKQLEAQIKGPLGTFMAYKPKAKIKPNQRGPIRCTISTFFSLFVQCTDDRHIFAGRFVLTWCRCKLIDTIVHKARCVCAWSYVHKFISSSLPPMLTGLCILSSFILEISTNPCPSSIGV